MATFRSAPDGANTGKQRIAVQPVTELSVIKRRPVGKGAWRMTLTELIESERADLAKLRRLRQLHSTHNETLMLVAEMSDEKTERVISLTELLHYRGEEAANGTGTEV